MGFGKKSLLILTIVGLMIILFVNSLNINANQPPPDKTPHLRNVVPSPKADEFRATVERQAQLFPDDFFIEALHYRKEVALTFDDGPDRVYTEQILNILKDYEIKATFFVTGLNSKRYPAILKRINMEGHSIGGHSYNHPDLRKFAVEKAYSQQIKRTNDIIEEYLDYRPAFFRPPYGAINDKEIEYFSKRNNKTILWSIDTIDWDVSQNSAEELKDKVMNYLHPGAIVLMHSGGGNRQNTIKALPGIIEELQEKGYTFKTIPELLTIPGKQ